MASLELKFTDEKAIQAAISELRNEAFPTNWALFNYVSTDTIELTGKGSGGVEELKSQLKEDGMAYGLLRVHDNIDGHITTKFVFISWCGEKVKFTVRSKMTTHRGAAVAFIGQKHVELYASNPNELSEQIVMEKVTAASGTNNKVKEFGSEAAPAHVPAPAAAPVHTHTPAPAPAPVVFSQAARTPTHSATSAKKTGGPSVPTGAEAGSASFANEAAITAAVSAVRADSDPTNWALIGYENAASNTIVFKASGSGGVEELKGAIAADQISYGLLRVTSQIDNTAAVKFVGIEFIPDKVSVIRKARIATHKGAVKGVLGQTHVDISASHLDELTECAILERVTDAAGTSNRVLTSDLKREQPAAHAGKGTATSSRAATGALTFVNEAGIKGVIQAVRSDVDPANWVLMGYDGQSNNVVIKGSGSGGTEELRNALNAKEVGYGLLRVTDQIDNSTVVKFVLISLMPETLSGIRKAKIATNRGDIVQFIGQIHVSIEISAPSELTDDSVITAVRNAAGTAVHVKAN